MTLKEYKQQFFRSELTHLNNAGLAPIPKVTRDEIQYWADRFYKEGFYTDLDYMDRVDQSRSNLSKLIGCEKDEIAFFQSTAGALSQVAFMLDLKPGDEVLSWDQEYSSNLYPWQEACKRKGATLRLVRSGENLETDVQQLIAAIDGKTKVVAISWVQFQTGARTKLQPLSAICQKRGIFLCVDIMQGLGLHEFNFKEWGVDAVAGGSHKWLTAPVGVGFLAIRSAVAQKLNPLLVGAYTFGTCEDPADLTCEPKSSALRFEAGSKQVLEITALGRSIELIIKVGVKNLEAEALRLAGNLRTGLQELGYQLHAPKQEVTSAIVNLSHPKYSRDQIADHLTKNNINFARRGPGIRLSPHAFNEDEDVTRVLSSLKNI